MLIARIFGPKILDLIEPAEVLVIEFPWDWLLELVDR